MRVPPPLARYHRLDAAGPNFDLDTVKTTSQIPTDAIEQFGQRKIEIDAATIGAAFTTMSADHLP